MAQSLKVVFTLLLCTILLAQTANLAKLAEHFPCKKTEISSSYRRLQRFFKEVPFDYVAIARLIMHGFKFPEVKFTLDRTNWELGKKHINILMLAMVFEQVAIPIFLESLGQWQRQFQNPATY